MNQKLATLILAIAAVAIVLGFLLLPSPAPPAAPPSAAAPSPAAPSSPTYSADLGTAIAATAPGTAAAPNPPTSMPWEDKLDALLTRDTDNATTVRGLVSAMQGVPPEAQEEFIAHAVNLCEDEQYELLAQMYLDPKTPKTVSETIFNDALNRPDEIKLPLLAQTLRNAAHPMTAEAREILEMYLDLQPGVVPPNGWDQAVAAYLKEQGAP